MSCARCWRALGAGVLVAAATGLAAAQDTVPTELPPPRPLPEPSQVAPQEGTPLAVPTVAAPSGPLPQVAVSCPAAADTFAQRCRAGWQRWRCCWQRHVLGYPEEFQAVPLGADLYAQGRTMVGLGEAALMVLYDYDFVAGAAQLSPRGQQQLAKIAVLLASNPAPVVIERGTCAPALADARRLTVLNALAGGPSLVPPERVVGGVPNAPGLRGLRRS
jgi:hypothetical protein